MSTQIGSSADQKRVSRVGLLISAQQLSDQSVTEISEDDIRTAESFWVAPLLAHRLATSTGLHVLAPKSRDLLRQHLCFESGFEMLTGAELRRVLAACDGARIDVLLMKGAVLAYLYYPAPHLRPRLDTDLLIRAADREAMGTVLETAGYERSTSLAGDGLAHQDQYTRRLPGGLLHAIDVHWKIANPMAFADLLQFDELLAASMAVPPLGQAARGPSAAHMLLLIALHRMAHHERDMDLLCMYDLHCVARSMTEPDWRDALTLADARAVSPILGEALHSAFTACPTDVPAWVVSWVEHARREPLAERFAAFEMGDRRVVDVILSDVRMSRGWRHRLRVLRQHAFPPAAYMYEREGSTRAWTLPYMYARRLAVGIPRIFRRGRYR